VERTIWLTEERAAALVGGAPTDPSACVRERFADEQVVKHVRLKLAMSNGTPLGSRGAGYG